jgi:DNA polymerase kappa
MADVINLADVEDDDVQWTEENNYGPRETAATESNKPDTAKPKVEPLTTEFRHLLGPVCPICSKALGPSTSNQGLNEHIDWCLNKDAIKEASTRSSKKAKREGVADRSSTPEGAVKGKSGGKGKADARKESMMSWLNKSG